MEFPGVIIGVGLGNRVVCADDFERARVTSRSVEWLVVRSIELLPQVNTPSVGNDNVVKRLVSTPKPGEADLDNHGSDIAKLTTTTTTTAIDCVILVF